jgi:ABC-type branched-subunit amino acid transport system substrate-binding protein
MEKRKDNVVRVAALLAAAVLLATGCRGGDDDGGGGEAAEEDGSIATDVGVTDEACPQAVNADNGCIYLGTISDLTVGPFAALGKPITDAQAAFWQKVNEDGGIGGYDVDVTTYVRDNQYNPEIHNQVYREIKPEVLALAQTLGSPTTAAIIDDMEASDVVGAPASWTSGNMFEDVILESGTNYCFEAMNALDWAVNEYGVQSVMAVHLAGDYGDDAAAGMQHAAEENGIPFTDVETQSGQTNQAGAIQAIVSQQPDLVFVTTGPTDLAVIVGQAAAAGYQGRFIGSSPTWNPGLLASPAAPALQALYHVAQPWATYDSDTPGHEAMREALGADVQGNDGYTAGWVWSYPLKAALEQAAENGDLTRAGVVEAIGQLESVDYQGMLPEGAGNFSGDPNETVFRESLIAVPDQASSGGVSTVQDFFVSPTAEEYELTAPCYQNT